MTETKRRPTRVVDNTQFKDRFQFILSVNGNIICQRYFNVNGFNSLSLQSEELRYTLDDAVELIKQNLVSKSRIYLWYVGNTDIPMTGFGQQDGEWVDTSKYTWFDPMETLETDPYLESERPIEGEFVFKFSFLVDDKVRYERIWDGNVYPRYIRNSVDLTNLPHYDRDNDSSLLYFSADLSKSLINGKSDLTKDIVRMLANVMSDKFVDKKRVPREYTTKVVYATSDENKPQEEWQSVTYPNSPLLTDDSLGWINYTRQKTADYNKYLNNFNLSDKDYVRYEYKM